MVDMPATLTVSVSWFRDFSKLHVEHLSWADRNAPINRKQLNINENNHSENWSIWTAAYCASYQIRCYRTPSAASRLERVRTHGHTHALSLALSLWNCASSSLGASSHATLLAQITAKKAAKKYFIAKARCNWNCNRARQTCRRGRFQINSVVF